MPKPVIWSPLSEIELNNTHNYLQEKWDEKVVLAFLDSIESLINQISKNPKQFPFANKKKKIRKCVVSMHNTILYQENKDRVVILRFFDTRQNPLKLK
jgi:plasmid stabilization system protein ParE